MLHEVSPQGIILDRTGKEYDDDDFEKNTFTKPRCLNQDI